MAIMYLGVFIFSSNINIFILIHGIMDFPDFFSDGKFHDLFLRARKYTEIL